MDNMLGCTIAGLHWYEEDKLANEEETRKTKLAKKKEAWAAELKENKEFLRWYYGEGRFDGAMWYLNSLEIQYYDKKAVEITERNEALRRKIKYASR